MRKTCLVAALAALVVGLGLAAIPITAQQPVGGARDTIGLLDMTYIFKNLPGFNARMDEMKQDVDRAEAEFRKQSEDLKKTSEELQRMRQGTPEYNTMESDFIKKQTELATRTQAMRREFLQRQAKIYYGVYQQVMAQVRYYCQQRGITIVLRFNGDRVDEQKADDILRVLNQPIVFYTTDHDITGEVLKGLLQNPAPPANNNALTERPGVYAPAAGGMR